jgi:hypothetical protein
VFKCHIVARAIGGTYNPRNFFLLCDKCRAEQDTFESQPAHIQWVWLLSHESEIEWFLRTFRRLWDGE